MKFSLEWLREFLDTDATVAEIAAKLNAIGLEVEDIEDPIMREVRYLDKLIDELAKGKAMEKILR